MSNTLQVRRGANASLPALNAGEFGFSTDTHQVYIGDGAANHELLMKDFIAAKGDLIGASANNTPVIVPVGSNEQILIADSTQAAGFKWGTNTGAGVNFATAAVLGTL